MKLLNTYDDKDEAEEAEKKVLGAKRLASERDGIKTIYNLFDQPTWSNFYALNMYDLKELKGLLGLKAQGEVANIERHGEIIKMLG